MVLAANRGHLGSLGADAMDGGHDVTLPSYGQEIT
jgi:hypothetical protein